MVILILPRALPLPEFLQLEFSACVSNACLKILLLLAAQFGTAPLKLPESLSAIAMHSHCHGALFVPIVFMPTLAS
jgi:hypothetical protein